MSMRNSWDCVVGLALLAIIFDMWVDRGELRDVQVAATRTNSRVAEATSNAAYALDIARQAEDAKDAKRACACEPSEWRQCHCRLSDMATRRSVVQLTLKGAAHIARLDRKINVLVPCTCGDGAGDLKQNQPCQEEKGKCGEEKGQPCDKRCCR